MNTITPTTNEKFLSEEEFIVSKTDNNGKILYGNETFISLSGYEESELVNKPHSILRHPDMPGVIFQLLWERLKSKSEIFAYVKNICKDGSFYWVMANVTPSYESGTNKVVGYHSSRRTPSKEAMQIIKPLYAQLLQAEKSGGIKASEKIMNDLLKEKGLSYDEFILSF